MDKLEFMNPLEDLNKKLEIIEEKLGYVFENKDLLILVAHPSFVRERVPGLNGPSQ